MLSTDDWFVHLPLSFFITVALLSRISVALRDTFSGGYFHTFHPKSASRPYK